MKKQNNVIQFPKQQPFFEFLDELKKAYTDNRLNNFICIYDCDYEKGKEREKFMGENKKYWFGEKSCTYLLGLTKIMGQVILDYMKEKNKEDEEQRE